jgi:hypothetical protein
MQHTGWVTDEDPAELAKTVNWKIFNPLDIVDGAARVMDPCLMVLIQKTLWVLKKITTLFVVKTLLLFSEMRYVSKTVNIL